MTVADLLAQLARLDPRKPVVIWDADTAWWLTIQTVMDRGQAVEIAGTYDETFDDEYHDHDVKTP